MNTPHLVEFKVDVSKWILDWVSQYNTALGVVPCPFAKQALLNEKIDWVFVESLSQLELKLMDLAKKGLKNEVVVIGMNPNNVRPSDLTQTIRIYNKRLLMPHNIVALEDHPSDVEKVNGVTMNQGKWAMVLLQNTSKLNNASEILRTQGYYDKWTQEELDDVVTWRFEKEKNENFNR